MLIVIELAQFESYTPEILKMCHHNTTSISLKAIRTLSFISVCPQLRNTLIRGDALTTVLNMLDNQPAAGICEAVIVFVNHVCSPPTDNTTENKNNDDENKEYIRRFFLEKNRLLVLLRYISVEDDQISISINAFGALAAILFDRLSFQESAIEYGLLERSMELLEKS